MIKDLLQQGRDALDAKYREDAQAKLGQLRAGSTGALVDGDVLGSCHRKAHLRELGLDLPLDNPVQTKIMFEGGIANEHVIATLLTAAGVPFAQEEDIPVLHPLSNGKTLSGRPDFAVVLDANGNWTRGVEAKRVSAVWTAKSVHYELTPKDAHLCQAGLYSLLMNRLPYSLVYRNDVQWHAGMLGKSFQTLLANRGWDLEYRYGKPFKILGFEREYDLTWDDEDHLCYMTQGLDHPVRTKITGQALLDFNEAVSTMRETGDLGPRPSQDSVLYGKSSYNMCDEMYCPLASVCDNHEDNYDEWVAMAKTICTT